MARVGRAWFWVLNRTVNRVAVWAVRRGRGPLSLVRHVGRRTGRADETPMLLVRLGGDFVAELTYGTGAAWYRNVRAAGRCSVLHRGVEYEIGRIEPLEPAIGRAAFGVVVAVLLRLTGRRDYCLLAVAAAGQRG
ncbi:nitroreductase/quinone reductase family protein [Actinoplanes sp. NPDC051851]|uniref:nitroreductase/quinone reductase family protein n=1 Tax=Actinoplanes sp. NPDC051851 TaxID=3154753 RepID=UPI00341E83FE